MHKPKHGSQRRVNDGMHTKKHLNAFAGAAIKAVAFVLWAFYSLGRLFHRDEKRRHGK